MLIKSLRTQANSKCKFCTHCPLAKFVRDSLNNIRFIYSLDFGIVSSCTCIKLSPIRLSLTLSNNVIANKDLSATVQQKESYVPTTLFLSNIRRKSDRYIRECKFSI